MIDRFGGRYAFLSNFYDAPLEYDGIIYANSEAAFQAQKAADPDRRYDFINISASEAKRLGRRVVMRSDWIEVRYNIMYKVCREKFKQNPQLLELLLDTGDEELVEGNTWGDRTWGRVNGVGENWLGLILMALRTLFRTQRSLGVTI